MQTHRSWPPTKAEFEEFQADPNNFKPDFIPNLTFRNAETYEIFPRPGLFWNQWCLLSKKTKRKNKTTTKKHLKKKKKKVAKSSTGYTIIHKGGTDSWGVPIDELTIPRAINYVFTVRGTFVETMELQKVACLCHCV